jgi:hypothetical protein
MCIARAREQEVEVTETGRFLSEVNENKQKTNNDERYEVIRRDLF